MIFTFRYEVDEYYTKKNNATVLKKGLQDQIKFLALQLEHPKDELNLKMLQKREMDKKRQALASLENRGLLSYIPEWPLLILGALSVIATRMLNYFMDIIAACFKRK
ncbi:MAG: hypothetical protein K0U24_06585 [Gammaproteobacteria bacterium]|nr:hypothetical protein [Gammaproteobacteria bacterium]